MTSKYIDNSRIVYWDNNSGDLTVPGNLSYGGLGGSGQTVFSNDVFATAGFYSSSEAAAARTDPSWTV